MEIKIFYRRSISSKEGNPSPATSGGTLSPWERVVRA